MPENESDRRLVLPVGFTVAASDGRHPRRPLLKAAPAMLPRDRYYIEIDRGPVGPWWRLKAANGEIVASSETYSSMRALLKTVDDFAAFAGLEVRRTARARPKRKGR